METVESIIYEFNERNADRIKDAAGQKVFPLNKKTKNVKSPFLAALGKIFSPQIQEDYYIVSNSNFVHRAIHVSETILVQDSNGRQIDLSIRCEISCKPGNEEKVARALLSDGNSPAYNLNLFLRKCVNRFQPDIEKFISNFYASNLPGQIEKFIMDQKDPSEPSAHRTGLTFHSVKCLQINIPPPVIPINLENIKIGFRDSVKQHTISLKCNLDIGKANNNNAYWKNISKEDFEKVITEEVQKTYYRLISESDSFKRPDIVETTVKKSLNSALQTHNREINNLKLEDLYVKSIEAKSLFEIDRERKNYLSADRETIGLKISLSVKIKDLMELESYERNLHLLKEKLIGCVDGAATNFITRINAGEFYLKISTDFAFKKSFVEEIRKKIKNLIDAVVTVNNVDYGETHAIGNDWTRFKAVISKDMREFVITGSFSIVKDDLSNIVGKVGRIFTIEDVKEKIIETLEASLEKRYLGSSDEFEKVTHDLLVETVSEAYGVIIKTQNIRGELTRLSVEDETVIEKIRELRLRKIELIARGQNYERLDEQILKLEEYKEKLTRSDSQTVSFRNSRSLPDSK